MIALTVPIINTSNWPPRSINKLRFANNQKHFVGDGKVTLTPENTLALSSQIASRQPANQTQETILNRAIDTLSRFFIELRHQQIRQDPAHPKADLRALIGGKSILLPGINRLHEQLFPPIDLETTKVKRPSETSLHLAIDTLRWSQNHPGLVTISSGPILWHPKHIGPADTRADLGNIFPRDIYLKLVANEVQNDWLAKGGDEVTFNINPKEYARREALQTAGITSRTISGTLSRLSALGIVLPQGGRGIWRNIVGSENAPHRVFSPFLWQIPNKPRTLSEFVAQQIHEHPEQHQWFVKHLGHSTVSNAHGHYRQQATSTGVMPKLIHPQKPSEISSDLRLALVEKLLNGQAETSIFTSTQAAKETARKSSTVQKWLATIRRRALKNDVNATAAPFTQDVTLHWIPDKQGRHQYKLSRKQP